METIVNQVLGQPTGPSLIDPTLSLSPSINDPAKLIPGQGTPVDAYGLLQQILTEQGSNSLIPGLLGVGGEVTPAASSFLVGLEGLGTSGPTTAAAPAASAASAPSSFLTTLGDIGGGLAGNFAAQALLGGDRSKQQAITGGIGGALGGLLGQALIPVPVLGAGVGSFLGNALAGIFGPDAGDPWDHANNAPTISGNILTAVHGWQTAAGMPNITKEFPDVAQRLINEAFAKLGSDDVGRFEELQKSGWLEGRLLEIYAPEKLISQETPQSIGQDFEEAAQYNEGFFGLQVAPKGISDRASFLEGLKDNLISMFDMTKDEWQQFMGLKGTGLSPADALRQVPSLERKVLHKFLGA